MKRAISSAVIGVAVLALGLTGCDPHPPYSANVRYSLRKDPILRAGAAKDLADDRYDPDRPGVLPIMSLSDIQKPDHPFHAKAATIDDKILRDPTKAPSDKQKELEDALTSVFGTPAAPTVNLKDLTINDIADREEKKALKGAKKAATTKKLEKILADIQADPNLADKKLAEGSTRYRVHCLHCHGVTGDGRGPTARWVNPHPRDFRAGMFKFQSVDQTAGATPPARRDLLRTLKHGIEGTAMPTFNLLKEEELDALVSYVTHLSIRGHAELNTLAESFSRYDKEKGVLVWEPDPSRPGVLDNVKFYTGQLARAWWQANHPSAAIKPVDATVNTDDMEALKASVHRGQQIFTAQPTPEFQKQFFDRIFGNEFASAKNAAVTNAIKAAEDKAIEAEVEKMIEAEKAKLKSMKKELSSDAEDKLREDFEKEYPKIRESLKKDHDKIKAEAAKDFGKLESELKTKVQEKVKGLLTGVKCVSCHTDYGRQAKFKVDDWATLVRPNNLPQGVYRGGRRPVDVYFRIHSGIPGSAMTPFGKTFEGNEEYIWDVVNFVQVLPYPAMRERLGVKLD